tara:strand:+ start:21906 stop:22118 length:213 start_codon:yes stop_codon:yes gene_type:complete
MDKTIKIKLTENEQSILEDAIKIARKKFRSFENGPKKNQTRYIDGQVLLEIRRKIYSKQRKFSDEYIYGN